MTDIAIRVENLSKQYRIGGPPTPLCFGDSFRSQARYRTIRESLSGAFAAPFRRLASVVRGQSSAVSDETIWALKDVSFEVQRGGRVRNSQFKIRDSFFHPELTGRENIYFIGVMT